MLSFVIPAFNEVDSIGRCVRSIRESVPADVISDIVVVDNGSTDGTGRLASEAGATVVPSTAQTISGVRNDGVRATQGGTLVFIDADCAVTPAWGDHIGGVLERLDEQRPSCAGSQVFPPEGEDVFLWTYWFLPFVMQESASHIGSANMVCRRSAFDEIGGFDESLATGEDYDFCARILRSGGQVLNVPELRVEHFGFPRTWRTFFMRERWHGAGDVTSISTFLASRVAVSSVLFIGLTVLGVVFLAGGLAAAGAASLFGALSLLFAASLLKFRHVGLKGQLMSLVILPVYFLARTLSVIDGLRGTQARRAAVRGADA